MASIREAEEMPLLESHTQEGPVLRWGRGAERSRSWRQDAVLTHVDTPAHATQTPKVSGQSQTPATSQVWMLQTDKKPLSRESSLFKFLLHSRTTRPLPLHQLCDF